MTEREKLYWKDHLKWTKEQIILAESFCDLKAIIDECFYALRVNLQLTEKV